MRKHLDTGWAFMFGATLALMGHPWHTLEYWVLAVMFVLFPAVDRYANSERKDRR